MMRDSVVLKKLRAGEVVSCVKLGILDPKVSEIAAMCGFDCIWIDKEHVLCDWSAVENHVRAAKIYDVDVIVRVERGSYSDYIKPFEADAAGIMVPHLMSVDEAKEVVRVSRFQPVGRRAVDGGNADGGYTVNFPMNYHQVSNEQKMVIVQVEDPEVVSQLDEIAALEGIDMLFFGPGDYSHAIGASDPWSDPRVIEVRKLVCEVARKYGKFAGTVADPENMQDVVDLGYQFIASGADVCALRDEFRKRVSVFHNLGKAMLNGGSDCGKQRVCYA